MNRGICQKAIIGVICALISATGAKGQVIYVDADSPGPNLGSSWNRAYNYLQDALEDAESRLRPVEIRVAYGVYTPDSNFADPNGTGRRNATFRLINGVTLKGGYAGWGMPDPNGRFVEVFTTILGGDLARNDAPAVDPCELDNDPTRNDNSYHVLYAGGVDASAVLDGFTITGGNANGPWSDNHSKGAGLYNGIDARPTLRDCTFFDNWAVGAIAEGAGMYNDVNSSPMVKGCTFTGNRAIGAVARGGAICNGPGSNPKIDNCIFSRNSAEGATTMGAGIYNDARSGPNLTHCTLSGNTAGGATAEGAGMYNDSNSHPTVGNCILWGDMPDEVFPNGEPAVLNYCDVNGGWKGNGVHNMNVDPCFADPCVGDYHLKSAHGRWDAEAYRTSRRFDLDNDGTVDLRDFSGFARSWNLKRYGLPADSDTDRDVDGHDLKAFCTRFLSVYEGKGFWVYDVNDPDDSTESLTSPCIDGGDPNSKEWRKELWPHGERVNVGAYGGTGEASLSASDCGNKADLRDPNDIDFADFAILAANWLRRTSPVPGDFNRDGTIDFNDLAAFVERWPKKP